MSASQTPFECEIGEQQTHQSRRLTPCKAIGSAFLLGMIVGVACFGAADHYGLVDSNIASLFLAAPVAPTTGASKTRFRHPAPTALVRREALAAAGGAVLASVIGTPSSASADTQGKTASGLEYKVIKSGTGGQPRRGDLITVRFKGSVVSTGVVFDNILDRPEPYYFRVGSTDVLPFLNEAVVMMRTGDRWEFTVPPELGFGEKGRPSSPGIPRIKKNEVLNFVLEIDGVPGRDPELIDLLDLKEIESPEARR